MSLPQHDPPQTAPDPRYPIGRFQSPTAPITPAHRTAAILTLAEFPQELRNAVSGLNHHHHFDVPYREGGWTVRQLVHHLADSHTQAVSRIRLALTEPTPTITAYDEKAWALLPDSLLAPPEWSLELIESLHARWVMLLHALTPEQWQRAFLHPERGPQTIEVATLLYAWHSCHHLAHITHLRLANSW